jgi:hypothetical protein
MISFKYYVEVVVDIQGKLAGLDKYLPTVGTPQNGTISGRPNESNGGGIYAPWGGHFVNTEEIRRERSVVYSVFEVVVGTRDSERRSPWKQPETDASTTTESEETQGNDVQTDTVANYASMNRQRVNGAHDMHRPLSWDQYWRHHPQDQNGELPPMVQFSPPPQIEDEQHLSEKERMQRAEARLLPSAPPEAGESSAGVADHAPSAPTFDNDRLLPPLPSAPPEFDFGLAGPSASSIHTVNHVEEAEASAPAYDHNEQPSIPMTDDKEEMRRQRFEMERSIPEQPRHEDEDEVEVGTSALPSAPSAPPMSLLEPTAPTAPTAPMLSEEEHFGFSAPSSHHPLPRYER